MKTRFFTALLSVLLAVGCLPLSSSASDVYHLGGDTDPVYQIEADTYPILFQSLASVSPLSTNTPTYWSSSDINNALKYLQNISSYTSKLGDTNTWLKAISTSNSTSNSLLNQISSSLDKLNNQFVYSSSGSLVKGLDNWFTKVVNAINELSTGSLVEQLTAIRENIGFPDGSSFYLSKTAPTNWHDNNGYGIYVGGGKDRRMSNATWYRVVNYILAALVTSNPNGSYYYLSSAGTIANKTSELLLVDAVAQGYLGLASILRGQSGSTVKGQIVNSDTLDLPTDYSYNNLLSCFNIIAPMQNDLAKLTYVTADPTTIELKKSQEENEQAVVDNFTGDKGVKADDIGSMSGMGDSLGSFTDTGVSMDDGFTQLNSGDTWNFFSEEVAGQLNTAPSTHASDEDFVHFYDPENKAYYDLLGRLRGGN